MSLVSIEPPKDIDPEHDVVKKCKLGRKKLPTNPIFVIIRVEIDGENSDARVIAYSYDSDIGSRFIEEIAAKEVYGRFWDIEKEGSPCFDPINENGEEKPLPDGMFLMWDEDTGDLDEYGNFDTGSSPALTIYNNGTAIARYKLSKAHININDLMTIETEGDRFFNRQ